MVEDLLGEYGGTIVPILRISLHKGPSIHITDVRFAIGPQEVEATDFLLELLDDAVADEFLVGREDHWEANFLAVLVSLHHSIEGGRTTCLGVHIVWPDGVDLHK